MGSRSRVPKPSAVERQGDLSKVISFDVEKAGRIITNVPGKGHYVSGRVRLIKYFNAIEKKIAAEVSARKSDLAKIRSQMAKNRAYNAKARAGMKKMLLHKMAVNAKRARDALDRQMARTARTFARQAEIANKRNRATLMRSAKTREIMRKNKRSAARALHRATAIRQRALASLDAQTNSKISQTNSHIAANAAQIKANAKKARDDLNRACGRFDKKMFHAREESKKGQSKLAATSRAMNKRMRAMIAGKVKAIAANTAAQFHKVRTQMARDRAHADMMLKHA